MINLPLSISYFTTKSLRVFWKMLALRRNTGAIRSFALQRNASFAPFVRAIKLNDIKEVKKLLSDVSLQSQALNLSRDSEIQLEYSLREIIKKCSRSRVEGELEYSPVQIMTILRPFPISLQFIPSILSKINSDNFVFEKDSIFVIDSIEFILSNSNIRKVEVFDSILNFSSKSVLAIDENIELKKEVVKRVRSMLPWWKDLPSELMAYSDTTSSVPLLSHLEAFRQFENDIRAYRDRTCSVKPKPVAASNQDKHWNITKSKYFIKRLFGRFHEGTTDAEKLRAISASIDNFLYDRKDMVLSEYLSSQFVIRLCFNEILSFQDADEVLRKLCLAEIDLDAFDPTARSSITESIKIMQIVSDNVSNLEVSSSSLATLFPTIFNIVVDRYAEKFVNPEKLSFQQMFTLLSSCIKSGVVITAFPAAVQAEINCSLDKLFQSLQHNDQKLELLGCIGQFGISLSSFSPAAITSIENLISEQIRETNKSLISQFEHIFHAVDGYARMRGSSTRKISFTDDLQSLIRNQLKFDIESIPSIETYEIAYRLIRTLNMMTRLGMSWQSLPYPVRSLIEEISYLAIDSGKDDIIGSLCASLNKINASKIPKAINRIVAKLTDLTCADLPNFRLQACSNICRIIARSPEDFTIFSRLDRFIANSLSVAQRDDYIFECLPSFEILEAATFRWKQNTYSFDRFCSIIGKLSDINDIEIANNRLKSFETLKLPWSQLPFRSKFALVSLFPRLQEQHPNSSMLSPLFLTWLKIVSRLNLQCNPFFVEHSIRNRMSVSSILYPTSNTHRYIKVEGRICSPEIEEELNIASNPSSIDSVDMTLNMDLLSQCSSVIMNQAVGIIQHSAGAPSFDEFVTSAKMLTYLINMNYQWSDFPESFRQYYQSLWKMWLRQEGMFWNDSNVSNLMLSLVSLANINYVNLNKNSKEAFQRKLTHLLSSDLIASPMKASAALSMLKLGLEMNMIWNDIPSETQAMLMQYANMHDKNIKSVEFIETSHLFLCLAQLLSGSSKRLINSDSILSLCRSFSNFTFMDKIFVMRAFQQAGVTMSELPSFAFNDIMAPLLGVINIRYIKVSVSHCHKFSSLLILTYLYLSETIFL